MAGLDPAIHPSRTKPWMAASRAAMTFVRNGGN